MTIIIICVESNSSKQAMSIQRADPSRLFDGVGGIDVLTLRILGLRRQVLPLWWGADDCWPSTKATYRVIVAADAGVYPQCSMAFRWIDWNKKAKNN